jgi:hypothetical protein
LVILGKDGLKPEQILTRTLTGREDNDEEEWKKGSERKTKNERMRRRNKRETEFRIS